MKRKICAVFLAVIMGFCGFASSFSCVASAISASAIFEGMGIILTIKEFIEFVVGDSLSIVEASNESYQLKQMEYNERICARYIASVRSLFQSQNYGDLNPSLIDAFLNDVRDNRDLSYINSAYGFNLSQNDVDMLRGDYNHVKSHYELSDNDTVGLAVNGWIWYDDHCNIDDNGNVQVPVEIFKEELEKQNQTLTPKNRDVVKYSWRDLSNGQNNYDSNQLGRLIGKNHRFLDKANFADGVYIQYYGRVPGSAYQVSRDGIDEYYSPFQYHIYLENVVEDGYYDSTGAGYPHTKYEWHCDALYYLMIDGDRSYTEDIVVTTFEDTMTGDTYHNAYGDFSFLNIGFMAGGNSLQPMWLYFYDNSALANSGSSQKQMVIPNFTGTDYGTFSPKNFLYTYDVSKTLDSKYLINYSGSAEYIGKGYNSWDCYSNLTEFEKYHDDDIFDYGFYASTEPFTTTYMFDITRLPSNSTVTISGDSVYDYSITDNSTGDTSTIYNYVTNNYAYPEKPDNGTNSGSGNGGSVGGNITVSGQVDVGGKVEIDVNINGGNGNGNGTSYDMPDMSPVDGYLNSALEESSGIRKFLQEFFGFLPNSLITVFGIAIVASLIARLWGR